MPEGIGYGPGSQDAVLNMLRQRLMSNPAYQQATGFNPPQIQQPGFANGIPGDMQQRRLDRRNAPQARPDFAGMGNFNPRRFEGQNPQGSGGEGFNFGQQSLGGFGPRFGSNLGRPRRY